MQVCLAVLTLSQAKLKLKRQTLQVRDSHVARRATRV